MIPFDQKKYNFDISKVEFNKDGVIDFYWPLDNKKTTDLMNSISANLIPYITSNKIRYPELNAVKLLYKWFICDVLRLFEATVVVEECRKDNIKPLITNHYRRLDALYNLNSLKCIFFLNHSSGPSRGRKIPKFLKKLGKEFIWNGFNFRLFRRYGSNKNDILAIGPSNLAIKHAKATNKLLRYTDFNEWFGPIPRKYLKNENKNSIAFEEILNIIKNAFIKSGYKLSAESTNFLSTFLNQANNFVNYHLNKDNDLLDKIDKEVWFGCGGSTIWHVIMIEKLRRKKIKVVTHDHGSGNSHHEQTPSHWVEFMHTDCFVTFNEVNERTKNSSYRKDLMFGHKKPHIKSIDSILGNTAKVKNSNNLEIQKKIKKIMYVATAFHGEGARLRPIFHDLTYFDWQIKLLSHLKNLNLDVTYKPHPEGATKVPDGFAESFGFKLNTKRFEEINENVDAYIIDFFFSSTTPSVLKKNKPVFFIDLGFPEVMPEALKLIKENCYYLKANYSSCSRLSIDFNKFDEFINNRKHIFNTSFSDLYFENV